MHVNLPYFIIIFIFNIYILRLLFVYKQKINEQSIKLIHSYLDQQFLIKIVKIINTKDPKAFDEAIQIISNYYDFEQIAIYCTESNELLYSSKNHYSLFLEEYIKEQILTINEVIKDQDMFSEDLNIEEDRYRIDIYEFNNPKGAILILLSRADYARQEITYILESINEMILLLSNSMQKSSN